MAAVVGSGARRSRHDVDRFAGAACFESRAAAALRARLLARLLRLPHAGDASDTRLVITPQGAGEWWRRTFDGRRMDTRQYQAGDGELAERLGLLELRFRLDAADGSLALSTGRRRAGVWRTSASAYRRWRRRCTLAKIPPARDEFASRFASPSRSRPVLAYVSVIDFEYTAHERRTLAARHPRRHRRVRHRLLPRVRPGSRRVEAGCLRAEAARRARLLLRGPVRHASVYRVQGQWRSRSSPSSSRNRAHANRLRRRGLPSTTALRKSVPGQQTR